MTGKAVYDPRMTWWCRMFGHKFVKITLLTEFSGPHCFRCGFDMNIGTWGKA